MPARNSKPAIIILDNDKDRCLREEYALDQALADKNIHATGMSNYGTGFLSRSGVPKEKFPCIDVQGVLFFPPRPQEELTYDILCLFLEMLLDNDLVQQVNPTAAA